MRYPLHAILITLTLYSTGAPAVQCDSGDYDGDGVLNRNDNCVEIANTHQTDSNGDGIGHPCDTDLNQDGTTNILDVQTALNAFGSVPGDPAWNPDADLVVDNTINVLDTQTILNKLNQPPGPSCGGVVITGDDVLSTSGQLTIGDITVQVDPNAYVSGDSLAWSYMTMPYLPDGFSTLEPPISLTSSVTTPVTLSVSYAGPGSVLWPTLSPGGLDRLGDEGEWVAPQPSSSNVGGVWRIDTRLAANVTTQIGPAAAFYGETHEVEELNPQRQLNIRWHTEDGLLPPQAALVQNAVTLYVRGKVEDPTCTNICNEVNLVILPPRVLSGEPNFLARYKNGTVYYNPVAFTRGDIDLELTTIHEMAHWAQACEMFPWFDEFNNNSALQPLLVESNPWTEAYATQEEIGFYDTPPYDIWMGLYEPWPNRFPVADAIEGNRLYNYHLGLPLSWLRSADAAPSLCEFWSNTDLPAAISTEDASSIMPNFISAWAQFTHNWNVPGMRDNIHRDLIATIGDASSIPLTARLTPGAIPFIVHDLAPICTGGTMLLDFSEEKDIGAGGPGSDAYSFHNVDPLAEHDMSIMVSRAGSQSISRVWLSIFSQGRTRGSSNFQGLLIGRPEDKYYVTYDSPREFQSSGMYIARTYDWPGPSCGQ